MGSATRFLSLLTPSPHLRHRCPSLLLLFRCQLHHHRLQPSRAPTAPTPTTTRLHPIKSSRQLHTQPSSPLSRVSHPWPEFHALLDNLSTCGYFNRLCLNTDDDYVAVAGLPQAFLRAASACLSFARERPNLLGMVSRRDVEVLVNNGMPFLFKNGDESVRRMKSFVRNEVLDVDEANTADLMKFLLSYVSDLTASLEANNLQNRELVESSVQNLLGELAKLSYGTPESNISSVQSQFPDRNGQMLRTSGQNIQMKRDVTSLTMQGIWSCLRCDYKRSGDVSYTTANSRLGSGYGYEGSAIKDDIESRLAVNEEKAQQSVSKASQLESTTDLGSAIEDEDFPEIMPLRKGVNRFVVSTRKTPLERRLGNAEYRRNLGIDGLPEGNNVQMGAVDETPDTKISHTLDDIFSCSPTSSESNYKSVTTDQNARVDSSPPFSSTGSSQYGYSRGSNSNYVPFVPLPADVSAKKTENAKEDKRMCAALENYLSDASYTVEQTGAVSRGSEFHNSVDNLQLSEKPVNQKEIKDKENDQAVQSDRWFNKLDNNTDVTSEVSDDDFREIMPTRKGENRFVVGKNKDRSLTSPMYKRRVAMEQASNTNFVSFVPFPPNYFAKKNRQEPEGVDSTSKFAGETSNSMMGGKLNDARLAVPDMDCVQQMENQQLGSGTWNSKPIGENVDRMKTGDVAYETSADANLTQNSNFRKELTNSAGSSYQPAENQSSGYSTKVTTNFAGSSSQLAENQNFRSSWTGKSLEGLAVKEPDQLDMSEEVKAERWFRRVSQIKDTSELSQIPDEDFPSIMPMRKGVNRFVVSKRKTPLERRLTSQQYRRNLPTVSSDPVKK